MALNTVAVVSARGGSKGVPGKNLRLLGGRPLVSYMIEAARRSDLINRVVVSTDDPAIAEVAKKYGAEVPFMRPRELAADEVPLIAVTKYVMEALDKSGWKPDIVVQLQPTCPFVPTGKINESIQKVIGTDSECAVSLGRIEHEHPYRAKRLLEGDIFESFIQGVDVEQYQNRQDLPTTYCTTGAIYTRRRYLLENWSGRDFCLGKKPRAVLLTDIQAINIDRLVDFQFAEFILKEYSGQIEK